MSTTTVVAFASLLALAGCHRRASPPPAPSDEVARFALSVVDAARAPSGLTADLVDDDLVETVRRTQLVLRTTWDTWDRDALLKAWSGDAGPDRQYPPAERPQKQRERATRGLRAALEGPCTARRWDAGLKQRVAFLVGPTQAKLPPEVVAGRADLAHRLEAAEMARVTCTRGDVAMLIVKSEGGKRRLVDVFSPIRTGMEVNPNERTMK